MTIIWTPWVAKVLWGAISDSVSLFGSRKKSWLILMSLIQVISLTVCTFISFERVSNLVVFLFLTNMSGAFMDVIVDAL